MTEKEIKRGNDILIAQEIFLETIEETFRFGIERIKSEEDHLSWELTTEGDKKAEVLFKNLFPKDANFENDSGLIF